MPFEIHTVHHPRHGHYTAALKHDGMYQIVSGDEAWDFCIGRKTTAKKINENKSVCCTQLNVSAAILSHKTHITPYSGIIYIVSTRLMCNYLI